MGRIDVLLPVAGAALVSWLIAMFVRRCLYRQFPFFFCYLLCSVLSTGVRLAVSGNYRALFMVYWATEALYAVLALLALHEVFRRVFLGFYLFWWFWLVFPA